VTGRRATARDALRRWRALRIDAMSDAETALTVAVDAGGADLGAAEVAAGAAIAAERGVRVLLFGDADQFGPMPENVTVVHAPISIAKASDPVAATRATPDASIVQAARAVGEGRADALVAGGSTGSALVAATFHIKRAPGIHRPALALPIPVPGRPITLLDVGANVEVRPEQLVQFAFMGAALAQTVLEIDHPRVALLNNGEEPTKGTPSVVEAYNALTQRAMGSTLMDFMGNIEGVHVIGGPADVIVADGFTGNIALKLIEGVSKSTLDLVRQVTLSSPRAALGGLMLKPSLKRLLADVDPEGAGGAYMLGLRKLGVVAHGRFTRYGWSQAILLAARGSANDVVGRTHAALEEAGALRRPAPVMSEHATTVPGQL
jgi:glycerol-3-phosphate acyltransferase PlsX